MGFNALYNLQWPEITPPAASESTHHCTKEAAAPLHWSSGQALGPSPAISPSFVPIYFCWMHSPYTHKTFSFGFIQLFHPRMVCPTYIVGPTRRKSGCTVACGNSEDNLLDWKRLKYRLSLESAPAFITSQNAKGYKMHL